VRAVVPGACDHRRTCRDRQRGNTSDDAAQAPSSEDVHILSRDAAWPKPPWEDVIAAAVHEAQCIGAVLLIIDTAPYWAAMPAEREKDAGAALALMTPLLEATRTGLAVLAEWHSRKGAGDDGDALRGSNAFAGSADIVLEIEKTQTPRQRAMLALSRFPQTPGTLLYEHDPAVGSWRVIGEGVERGDARTLGDRQALLAAREGGDELTRSDLEEHTGTPEVQWHGTLKALQDDGIVHRLGRGVKGDPHRFQIVRTDSAQVATQNERRNGEGAGLFSAAHPLGVQQKQTAGIVRTAQNPEPLPVNRYEAA